MAGEDGALRFVAEMQDNASRTAQALDGTLRGLGAGLPDIVAAIDLDAAGAVSGATAAAAAADDVVDGFDRAGQEAADRFDLELTTGLRGIDPALGLRGATEGIPDIYDEPGTESAERFSDAFRERARGAADRAAETLRNNKGALLAVGATLGVAAGAAFGAALSGGIEREQLAAKLTGQLNLTSQESARFGALAGQLYASNYGENLEEVNGGIASVVSSIKGLRTASDAELSGATVAALNFGSTFDTDVAVPAQAAGILIRTGLAGNAQQAFDLITAGAQAVGPAMVEPLLEASNEYATNFAALGFSGDAAFSALAAASNNGEIALDKAGDAVKEFTIRATDGSKTSVAAYKAIGLNADSMANELLAGGDRAQAATQKIVAGLAGITDPADRANTSIALFGTPLEDIGVDKVPAFLAAMQAAGGGLGEVAGRADALNATLGGTTGATIESLKRQFQTTFAAELGGIALPILQQVLTWATQFVGPITTVAAVLGTVAAVVGAVSLATAAWTAAQTIATVATTAWSAAQWLLNAALAAPLTPILLVIAAVAALVAGLVWFFTQTEVGQAIVQAVWSAIQTAIDATVKWITGTAVPAIVAAWQWIVDKAQGIYDGVKGVLDKVVGFFREWWPLLLAIFLPGLFLLLAAWNKWGDDILNAARKTWAWVRDSIIVPVGQFTAEVIAKVASFAAGVAEKWQMILMGARVAWVLVKSAVIDPVAEFIARVAALLAGFIAVVRQPITEAKNAASTEAKAFLNVGAEIVNGIITGVQNKGRELANKAAEIARGALNSAKAALGIASPSRKFRDEVGAQVGAGLIIGLTGTAPEVERAGKTIADVLERGFTEKLGKADLGYEAAQRVVQQVSGLQTQLGAFATEREELADKIEEATKRLQDAIKLRDGFADEVAGTANKLGSIFDIDLSTQGLLGEGGADLLAKGLEQAGYAVAGFRTDLELLRSQGLNDELYAQLAKAGPEVAGSIIKALKAGGPAAVEEVSRLQQLLAEQAQFLGRTTADNLYGAGVAAAEGLLNGLTSREGALYAKATEIANTIAAKIRAALDIRSPSRVTAKIGENIGLGLAVGIDDSAADVIASAEAIARAAADAASAVQLNSNAGRLAATTLTGATLQSAGARGGTATAPAPVYLTARFTNPITGEELVAFAEAIADDRVDLAAAARERSERQNGRGR